MEGKLQFEMVPADLVDQIVDEVCSPELAKRGFEHISARTWVRSGKVPIREVFGLGTLKSLCLTPSWAFSLDFVPRIAAGRVKWHRPARSAKSDLCYDPIDYAERGRDDWDIPRLYGSEFFRRRCEAVFARAMKEAELFYSSVNIVADLPSAFQAKLDRPYVRFGLLNYVQEPLAYAFTLAAVGREPEARKWLRTAIEFHRLGATEPRKLHSAFEAALVH